MKAAWLLMTALVMSYLPGYAQVVLRAGESYTHRFGSLAFQANLTFGVSGPRGAVFAYIEPTFPESLGPTNSYKVEMFEDAPTGMPMLSRTITGYSSVQATDLSTANSWQDLQGSFRVTALSGFITLQGFSLQVIRASAAGGFDIYGTDRIYLPPRPVLSILQSNGLATVRWTTATNFVLETSNKADTIASWQAVTNGVFSTGNVYSVTLQAEKAGRFFRLRDGP